MSKLVIVESNAKCKKIESFLGKGYKVIASFGHIRGITDGLKSISIENNYKPVYNILPTKKKYVANLKKAIKSKKSTFIEIICSKGHRVNISRPKEKMIYLKNIFQKRIK